MLLVYISITLFSWSRVKVVFLSSMALLATRNASFSLRILISAFSSSIFNWIVSIWLLMLFTSGES